MSTLLATLENGGCKAEIYETALPGQFSIHYCDREGQLVAEEPLTGVSTYHQREQEILTRIQELCLGRDIKPGQLSDAGEY